MPSSSSTSPPQLWRRRGAPHNAHHYNNAPYLQFGTKSTIVLALFSLLYAVFLICFLPMLHSTHTMHINSRHQGEQHVHHTHHIGNNHPHLQEAMRHVKRPHLEDLQKAKERLVETEKELVGKVKEEGKALKESVDKNFYFRKRGQVEKELLDSALEDFEARKKMAMEEKAKAKGVNKEKRMGEHHRHDNAHHKNGKHHPPIQKKMHPYVPNIPKQQQHVQKRNEKQTEKKNTTNNPTGFVLLGMHRSGTSMLGGLLVEGYDYYVGSPLIGAAADNPKGFFELRTLVLQNDEFMYDQNVDWASNVVHYDSEKALEGYRSGRINFDEGKEALDLLNDVENSPWLQKDPRMCITLPTWLELFDVTPAVVFTYRHPLEVAMSLKKRQHFKLIRGLRLWIVYNMRGIQHSNDLCRVLSSNDALLSNPEEETNRIVEELTMNCGVPKPGRMTISKEVLDVYVDPSLQHNKNALKKKEKERKVLASHNGGECLVKDFESDYSDSKKDSSLKEKEMAIYLKAMKIYCDLESGVAYEKGYDWPSLT